MEKIIVLFLLSIATLSAYPQLLVSEDGSTEVKTSNDADYGLKIHNPKIGVLGESGGNASGWSYGVYGISSGFYAQNSVGVAGVVSTTSVYPENASYGVLGEAQGGENGRNYGVFARLGAQSKYSAGFALYATTNPNDNGEMISQRYAGYFNGNVYINGVLTVSGDVVSESSTYQLAATESEESGDGIRMVSENEESTLEKLTSLNAATTYKNDFIVEQDDAAALNKANAKSLGVQQRKHYSLMAEQVEEQFPELVYTKDSGEKYINYTELIPILIQSIAELRNEVEALKGNSSVRVLGKQTNASEMIEPVMTQSELTIEVPANAKNATLSIYDANGKKVYGQSLLHAGTQTLSLPVKSLPSGTYISKLTTDNGTPISTQKIILSNH